MRRKSVVPIFIFVLCLANGFIGCRNGCNTPPPVSLPAVGQGIATWGDNRNGQLGDGSNIPKRFTAGAINLAPAWNALAAGNGHVLALKTDGTVWAWGENSKGQLGIGSTNDAHIPYTAQINEVTAIAAGSSHSLALKSNGSVWAWGDNTNGQLGNGTNKDATSPVQVSGFFLVRAVAISAGESHSLAIDGNGEVWAWGKNTLGQLGDSSIVERSSPVKVKHLSHIIQVAAGANHSLALKNDGTVWAWGDRRHLQLGDAATLSPSLTPIQVLFGLPVTPPAYLTNVKAIAAGGDHSLAITNDNEILSWGSDRFYESSGYGSGLGAIGPDGVAVTFSQAVQGVAGRILMLAAGVDHSLALTDDGQVWAWGHNDQGQLGDSTFVDPFNIVPVKGLKNAKAIAAGGGHSSALATASLKIDLAILDFGNVQVNHSATLSVVATNDGFAPVNINSFVSSNPTTFAITPSCATPVSLAPAAACTLQVTFQPASAGALTATLFINNDSPLGNLSVALKGNGTP